MKITDIVKKWFRKPEPEPEPELIQPEKPEEKMINPFCCHYCHKVFDVTSKMIFPMSVRALYKDYFFQGIGVKCPHCFKDCIYG